MKRENPIVAKFLSKTTRQQRARVHALTEIALRMVRSLLTPANRACTGDQPRNLTKRGEEKKKTDGRAGERWVWIVCTTTGTCSAVRYGSRVVKRSMKCQMECQRGAARCQKVLRIYVIRDFEDDGECARMVHVARFLKRIARQEKKSQSRPVCQCGESLIGPHRIQKNSGVRSDDVESADDAFSRA